MSGLFLLDLIKTRVLKPYNSWFFQTLQQFLFIQRMLQNLTTVSFTQIPKPYNSQKSEHQNHTTVLFIQRMLQNLTTASFCKNFKTILRTLKTIQQPLF